MAMWQKGQNPNNIWASKNPKCREKSELDSMLELQAVQTADFEA